VPVVTKPATSTALVAARIVEILIDATVLPEGALSFLAGGVGDLLEHLESQDVLAFTGSGVTGAILRGGRRAIERSVRINVEADSLNAAVLGPDVDVDGDTYELFIREVARDITQKAGQKCTAIRRVFAPRELYERVREDLAARVGEVRVGDPALAEVKMGPLATARQLADVREGVDRLKETAKVYFGGGRGSLVGVEGDRGFFMAPVLLASEDAAAAVESHCHEVFGPVATVMAYSGAADEASRLVNLGDGGLVSSVYSDDPVFIGEMLTGIAPYHGRLNVGSAKVAEHSMGPGTVLASLVHGGPGRAGGGEELGGLRGLAFYMQRVAVQGYRPMLERIWGAAGLLPL
jgi:oxepin-CoA hydrolase/3-oxo-5,6-dehydrosuberyl-CoA semialdehyde dehydrogenase